MVFRRDGQSENGGQFWSTDPGENVPIRPKVVFQAVRRLQSHSLIYFSHSETLSALANRNTGAIAGALYLATRLESRDPYRVMGGRP